jgi:hypothetical protein
MRSRLAYSSNLSIYYIVNSWGPDTELVIEYSSRWMYDSRLSLARKLTASQGFSAYSYGTAAWLTLQAVPLILIPSVIETVLSPEAHKLTGMSSPIHND